MPSERNVNIIYSCPAFDLPLRGWKENTINPYFEKECVCNVYYTQKYTYTLNICDNTFLSLYHDYDRYALCPVHVNRIPTRHLNANKGPKC